MGVLTEQPDFDGARNYWKVMKSRLKDEGNQLVTNCNQLKMRSPKDGKKYNTDVANTEQLLRIIQSIPSKKAEPFKLWLAQIGRERIEEVIDPELTIERALETYAKKGYSREWINQRLQAIQVRKELTDEWGSRGVKKGVEFAILTDDISKAWSGMTTREYKNYKGLKKEKMLHNYKILLMDCLLQIRRKSPFEQQEASLILSPTNPVPHDILKIGFQHLPPWLLSGQFQILDGYQC